MLLYKNLFLQLFSIEWIKVRFSSSYTIKTNWVVYEERSHIKLYSVFKWFLNSVNQSQGSIYSWNFTKCFKVCLILTSNLFVICGLNIESFLQIFAKFVFLGIKRHIILTIFIILYSLSEVIIQYTCSSFHFKLLEW